MTRTVAFDPNGWEDYVYWQTKDRKTFKCINQLITDVLCDPFGGIGKPEPLRHILSDAWSRRIEAIAHGTDGLLERLLDGEWQIEWVTRNRSAD